jgi:protection of telomeres protein 1
VVIDWQLKVSLKHPSFDQDRECKWFNSETQLPDIKNIGDVVLIRQAKVTVRDMPLLVCYNDNKRTVVFRANFSHFVPGSGQVNFLYIQGMNIACPSSQEQLHAQFLQQWAVANTNLPSAQPSMPHPTVNKRLTLLKNVTADHYYDVVGEVVKLFSKPGYLWTEIYVTDYTTNNLFFPYTTGDAGQPDLDGSHDPNYFAQKRQWPGPQGKMSIRVTLWEPTSVFTNNNVSIGDLVLLRNMHVKYKEKYLEGACYTDRKYPEKVAIAILKETDNLCASFINRKRAHVAQAQGAVPGNETKKQKKKRLKKERDDKQKALERSEMIKRRDVEMAIIPRGHTGDQPSNVQKSGLNANGKSKKHHLFWLGFY